MTGLECGQTMESCRLLLGGGLYTLGCAFHRWKSLPYAHHDLASHGLKSHAR